MQVQNQVARTLRANLSRLREVLDSTAARGIKSIGRAPFFGAYERPGVNGVKMATPEKALLDLLYLSSTKTRLSAGLAGIGSVRRLQHQKRRKAPAPHPVITPSKHGGKESSRCHDVARWLTRAAAP